MENNVTGFRRSVLWGSGAGLFALLVYFINGLTHGVAYLNVKSSDSQLPALVDPSLGMNNVRVSELSVTVSPLTGFGRLATTNTFYALVGFLLLAAIVCFCGLRTVQHRTAARLIPYWAAVLVILAGVLPISVYLSTAGFALEGQALAESDLWPVPSTEMVAISAGLLVAGCMLLARSGSGRGTPSESRNVKQRSAT